MEPERVINRAASWFGQVPAWICDFAGQVGAAGIAVFCVLCIHASKDGRCFPSLETLARETGLSKPTVIGKLKELEAAGLIKKIRKGGGRGGKGYSNTYEIVSFLETVKPLYPLDSANSKATLPLETTKRLNGLTQRVKLFNSNGKATLPEQTQEQTHRTYRVKNKNFHDPNTGADLGFIVTA